MFNIDIGYISNLGISGAIMRGNEIWMNCPYHDETKPSSKLNLETGRFKCFGCGKSQNILEFLVKNGVKMSDLNMQFFLELSRVPKFVKQKEEEDLIQKFKGRKRDEEYISEDFLNKFTQEKFPKKFMEMMGRDQILKHEIMFDLESNSLVFPVRDLNGGLIGIAGREYYTGKFFFYASKYKGLLGINRALYSDKIIIVEGLRDWLLLGRFTEIPVVSLMGRELKYWKNVNALKELRGRNLREIYLGLDNDKAGEESYKIISEFLIKEKLCDKLYRLKPVRKDWVKMYEQGDSLEDIFQYAVSYLSYRMKLEG